MNCHWIFVIISLLGRPLILTENKCVADSGRRQPHPKKLERGGPTGPAGRGITTKKYVRNKLSALRGRPRGWRGRQRRGPGGVWRTGASPYVQLPRQSRRVKPIQTRQITACYAPHAHRMGHLNVMLVGARPETTPGTSARHRGSPHHTFARRAAQWWVRGGWDVVEPQPAADELW